MPRTYRGYAPNRAFWAWMEKHGDALDLEAEASKILDYFRRHPGRNCSAQFLTNWMNRAIADQRGAAVNGRLAEGRQNGISKIAAQRGPYHKTCGTYHRDLDICPIDAQRDQEAL